MMHDRDNPTPPEQTPEQTPDPSPQQVQELALRYLDGRLTEQEARRLHVMMIEDAEACDQFIEAMYLQCTLREDFSEWLVDRDAAFSPRPAAERRRTGRGVDRRPIGWAIAATVALSVGLIGWWMRDANPVASPEPAPTVGVLIEARGAQWDADSQVAAPGRELRAGLLTLASGSAQVMFDSSAVVDLIGPCEFEMTGPNRGRLNRGTLGAYVPPRAAGFTVDLPDGAKVVDLGTRYQVDVDAAGRTELWVLEGSVLVESAMLKTTLAEGDDVVLRDGSLVETPATDDPVGLVRFSTDRIGAQQVQLKQDGQYDQPTQATVFNDGRTLRLGGNAWKTLDHPYDVTPLTVLEADFRTTRPGEIHAIGFDGAIAYGDKTWRYTAFQLFGSETVPHVPTLYVLAEAGRWVHVKIPVGEHFVGHFDRLMFVCDDDAAGAADSWFRNVRVYERPADGADTKPHLEQP